MGYFLALTGLGLMVGLSGAGSAIGLSTGGSAVIGMLKKRPEAFANGLILSGLPATQGLYGFVAFIMYNESINPEIGLFQGAVVFGAGIALGLAAIVSAIMQGRVSASGIAAIGNGHNVFGNTFILAAFPEFYAILALVAVILMRNLILV